jgi:hypothetical protein
MRDSDRDPEHAVREAAYFIWLREGQPEGRAHDHWQRAISEFPMASTTMVLNYSRMRNGF